MASALSGEQIDAIHRAVDDGWSNRRIARELKHDRKVATRYANRYRQSVAPYPEPSASSVVHPAQERSFEESHDGAKLEFKTSHPVRTLEDAIRFGEVDTAIWVVTKWKVKSWEVVIKNKDKQGVLHHLWGVTMELERVVPRPFQDALEAIFAKYDARAPFYPTIHTPRRLTPPVALVLGLFDAHFGKLSWAPESGEDYDLRIAETVYENAIFDLLAATAHLNVEHILLPIGNDGLHIDSENNTTTGGTVVDVDGRFAKIIEVAERAHIRGIEVAMRSAPVEVFHVPGNHDRMASYQLVRTIAAWFHNTDRVSVDCSPRSRKYRTYGNVLLGFTHGDGLSDSKVKSLMSLMMAEERERLSQTKFSEWFCGHQHRNRVFEQKSTDTYQGVVVRFLNALSSTDSWHHDQLLVGSRHAAEVYVYDKTEGYKGHFVAPVRR